MIYKSFSQNNTNKQKRHSKKNIRVEVDNSHLNFFLENGEVLLIICHF